MFELSHDAYVSILLFFIGASLLLYVILGGADYGAGILELLPLDKLRGAQKNLINSAMGPVWEANHMWLIILVVILFMGFPPVFTKIMIALHIPMVALLVGIVVRGSVFTFRHYDAIQDVRTQRVYTWFFGLSSLWTSFWIGIIAASLYRGNIDTQAKDFMSAYVAPWWGIFPVVMGFFTVVIFAFLASIYLIGESSNPDLVKLYRRRAFVSNILVVFLGGVVFLTSELEGGSLFSRFIDQPFALFYLILATLLFGALWLVIYTQAFSLWTRAIAAGQAALILMGWFSVYAPNALLTRQGPVNFYENAAPTATLYQLNLALLIGSLLIFPSLFYLLRVFKGSSS